MTIYATTVAHSTGMLSHQHDRRTLNYIPASKVPAFTRLFDIVVAAEGSENKAFIALKLQDSVIRKARQRGILTDRQARAILTAYKAWKARR